MEAIKEKQDQLQTLLEDNDGLKRQVYLVHLLLAATLGIWGG